LNIVDGYVFLARDTKSTMSISKMSINRIINGIICDVTRNISGIFLEECVSQCIIDACNEVADCQFKYLFCKINKIKLKNMIDKILLL